MNDVPASAVALIPARHGSKRVPGKNVRRLGLHPVLAYTIAPAIESGVFDSVIVSTDSEETAAIARHYGAEVPFLRPAEFAGDTSPDIEWVEYTLAELARRGRTWDCFSLLRPTSPFRTAATIRRAWARFLAQDGVDSLRAVEKCSQHPGKMWVVDGDRMTPLLSSDVVRSVRLQADPVRLPPSRAKRASASLAGAFGGGGKPDATYVGEQPWHSTPYQALPPVYVQNASLEIAWTRVVFDGRTIAGDVLAPFFTEGYEGFDINDRHDWIVAERLIADGEAALPPVPQAPYGAQSALVY